MKYFPADKRIVYFDNAATSFPKPPSVLHGVDSFLRTSGGNPGRSSHRLAMKSAESVYQTREKIAEFFNFPFPENVTFTQNATYALNMAIKGFVKKHGPCHVLISDMEHNAVLRPVKDVCEHNACSYSVFSTQLPLKEAIENVIQPQTKLLVTTLASNICGTEISLKEISEIRQEYRLFTVVDASQAAGHIPINLTNHPVDVLCAPGHKGLLGIMGCGFGVYNTKELLPTLLEGGSGSDSFLPTMPEYLPERMESGTLPTVAIASLYESLSYLQESQWQRDHTQTLLKSLYEGINETKTMKTVSSYGHGVISFQSFRLSNEEVSQKLDEKGICVRTGFHCAPLAHTTLDTLPNGTIRASLSRFNSMAEVEYFLYTLHALERKFSK